MKFLTLVRYQNLLLIALMQSIFHFGFLRQQHISLALSDLMFCLLVLATVCIAAGGYVINNVLDVPSDLENKPQEVVVGRGISEAMAYNIYFALNVTGVGIGFYLSNEIHKPGFAAAFIIVAATLYLYANSLKGMLVVGNLVVALLLAFSVVIVGIFDLLPLVGLYDQSFLATLFGIITDYAIFAFLINLVREIVKDAEDVNGDYNQGLNTLPIALGVSRTSKLASILTVLSAIVLSWYLYTYIFNLTYATIYGLVLLIAPLIFVSIKLWSAQKQKDFRFISAIFKLILLFGILSIAVITFNMQHNA